LKTLLIGANGQLGHCLQQANDALAASERLALVCADLPEIDITDAASVNDWIAREKPALIFNSAAYTAVDKAESEPELAAAVNDHGVAVIGQAAAAAGIRVIHVSTDFVFSGEANAPYGPDVLPEPRSVYGRSKLAGEQSLLDSGADAVIVRTSWLYSEHGANFVKTMLRLMSERDRLGVVADQIGSPTSAHSLADCLLTFARKPEISGMYHWSDLGEISWHDFAVAIQEEGRHGGLLQNTIPVDAISTADYPTPASRPAYSVLDCSSTEAALGIQQVPWRKALRAVIIRLGATT
jgi:dTDP-4-dehydrorhamnose reductase